MLTDGSFDAPLFLCLRLPEVRNPCKQPIVVKAIALTTYYSPEGRERLAIGLSMLEQGEHLILKTRNSLTVGATA